MTGWDARRAWRSVRTEAHALSLGVDETTGSRQWAAGFGARLLRLLDRFELHDPPEREGRFGDWGWVRSGGRFYPLDPRATEVQLNDLFWSLSNLCRYFGHVEFYSVLTHTMLVEDIVRELGGSDPYLALRVLGAHLHDGHEAYLGDMTRPLKRFIPGWKIIERAVDGAIEDAVRSPGLLTQMHPLIRRADDIALAIEARDLCGDPSDWNLTEKPFEGFHAVSETPRQARDRFQRRWNRNAVFVEQPEIDLS